MGEDEAKQELMEIFKSLHEQKITPEQAMTLFEEFVNKVEE